jgi:predicted DNA-binding transcriptional regulator YafY
MDYRKENGERKTYLIEPYSLRVTADNNVILYGMKLPSAEIRSFRTDRIINATVTEETFAPRYTIDFIPAGPAGAGARPAAAQRLHLPQGSRRARQALKRPAKQQAPAARAIFSAARCATSNSQDRPMTPP